MKTRKLLALLLSIVMLISVMPTSVLAYDDPRTPLGDETSESESYDYTLPIGVTMKPLEGSYLAEPDNLGDDILFVIKSGGRYYAMKDVAAREKAYTSIPAVDVTEWINDDGTLTVPAETLGVAFWRYERRPMYDYGNFINGGDKYLSYGYDYEGVDGDSDYTNDAERTYTGEFYIKNYIEDSGISSPYYESTNGVSGTLAFGGYWEEWINNYRYITHRYTMIVDISENGSGEKSFEFRYLGSDVEYEGDEVEGYLYYADCRHQFTVRHAEYDAPTCMDKGCKEYWYCEGCGKFSLDETFTDTLMYKPVLPALGHDYGDTECANCERPVPEYTKITSYEQFRTIKPGASFIMVAEIDDGNGGKEYYVLKEPLNFVNSDTDEDGKADILAIDKNENGTPDILETDKDGDGIADAMMYDGFFGDEYLDGVLDDDEISYYMFELENEYTNGYMVDMRTLEAIKVTPKNNGKINVKDLGALEIYMERLFPDSVLDDQYYGDGATVKDYENDFIFRIPNFWIRPMVTVDNNYYDMPYEQGDSKWWGVLFGKDVKEIASERFDESFPDDAVVLFTERFYSINAEGELEYALRFLVNGENKNFIITSEMFWEEIEGTQIPIYLYSSDAGEEVHEHVWDDWDSYGEEVHKRVCTVEGCTAFDFAAHNYGEECTPDTENYELGHWVTCTECGGKVHENHTRDSYSSRYPNNWQDVGDGIHHVVYCTECQGPVEYAEHRWYDWYTGAKEIDGEWVMGHYTRCKDFPCQAEKWRAECIYDEGVVTAEPTCAETGVMTYTCTAEGCDKTHTKEIPALGHTWSEWGPSATDASMEERTCLNDPNHKETRPVHQHIWSEWTPNGDGETHSRTCSAEGCPENKETAPHAWDNGVETDAPTCTEAGVMTYTCGDCGLAKKEYLDALGHEFGKWNDDGKDALTDTHTHICTHDGCGFSEQEAHEWSEYESDGENTHTKVCPVCEGVRTDGHEWDGGVETKPATHIEVGIMTYTCTVCGEANTEEIPKTTDHEWSDWYSNQDGTHSRACVCNEVETEDCKWDNGVVDVPPTHTELGTMLYTCTDCGATKTEDIPMLTDHQWGDWVENKTDSATHIRYCICNESETAPHSFDDGEITKPATHMETGVMTYTCEDCGYTYDEEIPKTTDHEWSDWYSNQDGTHSRACVCNEVETKDCKWDNGVVDVPPTHTELGAMLYTCTDCGATKTEDIPMLTDHQWGDWVENKTDSATHIRYCICNESETAPHSFDDGEITKPATHTETGVMTYTCEDCGYTYDEEIPVTPDHEWGKWVDDNNGKTHSHTCECGETESEAHIFNNGTVTEKATHTETGVMTYTCEDCGYTYDEEIPVTPDHEFGKWTPAEGGTHEKTCACGETVSEKCVWDDGVITRRPTHTAVGIREFTCTVCGHTRIREIPKTTTHTWGSWIPDAANNNGHIRVCICGERETAPHNCGDGVITKAATHTETGIKTYTCSDCGYSYNEVIPVTSEHTWTEWKANGDGTHTVACACGETEKKACSYDGGVVTKQPTHTEEGVKTYTCTVCGHTKTESVAKTAAHEWGAWSAGNDGKTHTRSCACGASETKDHTFDAGTVTKEPTHLENGVKKFTCTVCAYAKEETLAKTAAHTFGEWKPEATVSGKHFRECACGEKETADCVYDGGVVTKQPTYEAEGVKTYTCAVCGGAKNESIDKLEKAEEIVSPDNGEIKINTPTGSGAVLNKDTLLKVEEVKGEVSDEVKVNIEAAVGESNTDVLASYDISLILDGVKVQPGGKVEVTLPIPENAEDYDSLRVVYIDDNGNVTPCETRVNGDGTLTFVTDHFSRYAIIGVSSVSPAIWITISVVSAVLVAGAVTALIVFKKKKGIA